MRTLSSLTISASSPMADGETGSLLLLLDAPPGGGGGGATVSAAAAATAAAVVLALPLPSVELLPHSLPLRRRDSTIFARPR